VLGFAVFRISVLSSPKADEEALVEALANYKEVKINEETVTAIKNLIDSDVEVNPSFDNRNNPFSD
jgi:hypothetical protein